MNSRTPLYLYPSGATRHQLRDRIVERAVSLGYPAADVTVDGISDDGLASVRITGVTGPVHAEIDVIRSASEFGSFYEYVTLRTTADGHPVPSRS